MSTMDWACASLTARDMKQFHLSKHVDLNGLGKIYLCLGLHYDSHEHLFKAFNKSFYVVRDKWYKLV